MGFFSGLAKPASGGVDGFLAALRDKLDRDRLLAAQAIVQGDPAAAMQIRARSQAIDAQRAEAKERARKARMGEMMEKKEFGPARAGPFGGGLDGADAGLRPIPNAQSAASFPQHPADPGDFAELQELQTREGWNPGADAALQGMLQGGRFAGAELRPAAVQVGFPGPAEHAIRRHVSHQAQGIDEGIADAAGQVRLRSGIESIGGHVDLERTENAERTGSRVGEGLGASIPAAFKPPASRGDQNDAAGPPPRNGGQGAADSQAPTRRWDGGHWTTEEIESRATNAMRIYDIHVARGMSPEAAAGWAANAEAESHGDHRRRQDGGTAYGLFQWERPRRRNFEAHFGYPMEESTLDDQLKFRDIELLKWERPAARRVARSETAGEYGAAISRHYERPDERDSAAADRANLAEAILRRVRRRGSSGD